MLSTEVTEEHQHSPTTACSWCCEESGKRVLVDVLRDATTVPTSLAYQPGVLEEGGVMQILKCFFCYFFSSCV